MKTAVLTSDLRPLTSDGSHTSILRSAGAPKPVVLVDTRERQPLPLREYHPNGVAAERLATLKTGDYTVERMEELLALERKSLVDMATAGC